MLMWSQMSQQSPFHLVQVQPQLFQQLPAESLIIGLAAGNMTANTHIETERKYTLMCASPGYPELTGVIAQKGIDYPEVAQPFLIHFAEKFVAEDSILGVHQIEEFVI